MILAQEKAMIPPASSPGYAILFVRRDNHGHLVELATPMP